MKSLPLIIIVLLIVTVPISSFAQWPAEGVLVSNQMNFEFESLLVPDGEGGAFVFYGDDPTSDTYFDLFMTRVDGWGGRPWAGPVTLSASAGNDRPFDVCSDGDGGAYVCFAQNDGAIPSPLWVLHFGSDGVPVFPGSGVLLAEDCGRAAMVPDGTGGVIVFWEEYEPSWDPLQYDIYAQRLDFFGSKVWSSGDVAVCTAADYQYIGDAVAMPGGGAVVSWRDQRDPDYTLPYVQMLSGDGTPQWTSDGFPLATITLATAARLAVNPLGGVVAAWSDERNYPADVYTQYLALDGTENWTANGVAVGPNSFSQGAHGLACYPDGSTAVVWTNGPSGPTSLAFQVMRSDGTPVIVDSRGDPTGKILATDAYHSSVSLEADARGGVVCSWTGDATVAAEVYAQRFVGVEAQWGADPVLVSQGPGIGKNPSLITDDEGGSLIAFHEPGQGTAQRLDLFGNWGHPAAAISMVEDVDGDEGGWVRVRCAASRLEAWGSVPGVTGYNLWRRLASGAKAAGAIPEGVDLASAEAVGLRLDKIAAAALGLPAGDWESVGFHAATGEVEYVLLAPTRADSTEAGVPWESFCVTTHTDVPGNLYSSPPDSAYSVDNLAPGTPPNLTGALDHGSGTLQLQWTEVEAADLSDYRIYRGDSLDFPTTPDYLAGVVVETTFPDTDPAPGPVFYKVSARDRHGNEGVPAVLASGDVSGVTLPVLDFRLEQNRPNPFNPATVIWCDLPEAGPVKLEIFAMDGRRVAVLLDEMVTAGSHRLEWHGRDDDGRPASSGTYLYRLTAGDRTETKRMMLVK